MKTNKKLTIFYLGSFCVSSGLAHFLIYLIHFGNTKLFGHVIEGKIH